MSGCASDSVYIPIKDHAYIAYARKLMGKDGSKRIKDGPHYEFHPNGRTKYEFVTKDGKLNGIATTWSVDGRMTSRYLYRNDEILKDLLAEAQKKGTGVYTVKVAKNRKGVKRITTKQGPEKAAHAVKEVTADVTTQAVETIDNPTTNAIQPIKKRSGPAVKKLNTNPAVF